jgi:hypothetical protein
MVIRLKLGQFDKTQEDVMMAQTVIQEFWE